MRLEDHFQAQMRTQAISEASALQQFSDLLDESFEVATPMHFFDDFPVWDARFQVENVHRVGVFNQNVLLSAAAVRVAKIKTVNENKLMKIGIIGGVATRASWRGRGMASKAVRKAVQWACEKGAAAVFLWGSEHSMYQKLGFDLCGRQMRVPLHQVIFQSEGCPNSGDEGSVHEGWIDELFELIRKRPGGLALSDKDILWYRAHKNVRWFYQGLTGRPVAYAALGRGIDLGGVVHEWGGESVALAEIFRKISKMDATVTLLGSLERFCELDARGWRAPMPETEYLCLAKILNPLKVIRAYYPNLDVELREQDGFLRLTLEGQAFPWMTERQLTSTLLDGIGNNQVGGAPKISFPLWFWGLDAA